MTTLEVTSIVMGQRPQSGSNVALHQIAVAAVSEAWLSIDDAKVGDAIRCLRKVCQELELENLADDSVLLLSRWNKYEREDLSGGTPQESYADIAKAAIAHTRLVERFAKEKFDGKQAAVVETTGQTGRSASLNSSILAVKNESTLNVSGSKRLRKQLIDEVNSRTAGGGVILSAKQIKVDYGGNGFCLGPVSFELRRGQIVGVFGKNGSGKSTLLRVIAGLTRHTEGALEHSRLGLPLSWGEARSGIAFVSRRPFFNTYSIKETLEYSVAVSGRLGANNERAVRDYLARYNLEQYEGYKWSELSEGFLMRFELLRGLAVSPDLLVLDEPLANLDFQKRVEVLDELEELARTSARPICIVFSSHHIDEVEIVSDAIIALDQGRCLYAGEKNELARRGSGSVYRIVGDISGIDFVASTDSGVDRTQKTLGGALVYFRDRVSISGVLKALPELQERNVASISDVSGSVRTLLEEGCPKGWVRGLKV